MPRSFSLASLLLSLPLVLVGCHSHSHHGHDDHGHAAHTEHGHETQARTPVAEHAESSFTPEHYQFIIDTLCAPEMEGRDAGTKGIELARDYILDRFVAAGLEPAFVVDGEPSFTQPLTIPTGRDEEGNRTESQIENVGGLLPGVGALAEEVVVIGAHYDHIGYGHYGSADPNGHGHIHPGADDNASGTAGVILLADLFAQAAQDRSAGTPRRTILFTCFAGEERGLFGSRYMTINPEQWNFDHGKVSGMINMDMIGRLRNDELYAFSHETGKQWRGWIEEANQDVQLDAKLDISSPGGSDHFAFISAGIPAVFFNTWLHEDVHTPNDTPDKINAQGSVRVLTLVADVLDSAATHDERITFVAPPPRQRRPYLGVMLGSSDEGVSLDQVVPEGPMEQAGAQAGDVLLSLDGNAVSSRRDVLGFLSSSKPGAEVKAQVKRGEETVELTVELGGR